MNTINRIHELLTSMKHEFFKTSQQMQLEQLLQKHYQIPSEIERRLFIDKVLCDLFLTLHDGVGLVFFKKYCPERIDDHFAIYLNFDTFEMVLFVKKEHGNTVDVIIRSTDELPAALVATVIEKLAAAIAKNFSQLITTKTN